MPLKRVLYISKARRRMAKGELADLLAGARLRNQEHGITGMLLYDSGYFAQILEGPHEAIGQLLENINSDPRHDEYHLISESNVTERYVEDWSMDWRDLSQFSDSRHARVRELMRDRSIGQRDTVYQALVAFVQDHSRRQE